MADALAAFAALALALAAGCSGKLPATQQSIAGCDNPCATMVCPDGNQCTVGARCTPLCQPIYPQPGWPK